jgi:putative transposase
VLQTKGLSQRRACHHLGVARSSVRYDPQPDQPVKTLIRQELKRLSPRHRRYGRPRPLEATRPNEVWCFDLVHDRTESGQKLKLLSVLDEYTPEWLEIRVEKQMDNRTVVETLDELMTDWGRPRYTRSDNGPEFVAKGLRQWLHEKGVAPMYIEPGSPWENGFVESFNGKLQDECLKEEIFWRRAEAQVVVNWWQWAYNHERPHRLLQIKIPRQVEAAALGESRN